MFVIYHIFIISIIIYPFQCIKYTNWCNFLLTSSILPFFKSEALVTMNYENVIISISLLKNRFTEHRSVWWKFLFLHFEYNVLGPPLFIISSKPLICYFLAYKMCYFDSVIPFYMLVSLLWTSHHLPPQDDNADLLGHLRCRLLHWV